VQLEGVSCATATRCTAVGNYLDSTGHVRPLAERWNGVTWIVQPTPVVSDAGFNSVSCATLTSCVAVGEVNQQGAPPLIERWDGAAWTIEAPGAPPPAKSPYLFSVSCATAGYCVAVGGYFVGGRFVTLAEVADAGAGGAWTVMPTPNPADADLVEFLSVSCAAPDMCLAVGDDPVGLPDRPLAEQWDGATWTQRDPITPDGAFSAALSGVSCPNAHVCLAVGSSEPVLDGPNLSLAERFRT
jgi:hypothetical protein